jgi:hypothetical protein
MVAWCQEDDGKNRHGRGCVNGEMISIERRKFGTAEKKFALITDGIFFLTLPFDLGWVAEPGFDDDETDDGMDDSIRGQGFANIRFRSGHESLFHGSTKRKPLRKVAEGARKGKRLRRVQ